MCPVFRLRPVASGTSVSSTARLARAFISRALFGSCLITSSLLFRSPAKPLLLSILSDRIDVFKLNGLCLTLIQSPILKLGSKNYELRFCFVFV